MNKSCNKELKTRLSGCIFSLLYLAQITILSIFHYQMHTNKGYEQSWANHACHSHQSSCENTEIFKRGDRFKYRQSSADHHCSHNTESCSLCLSMHEGATVSINVAKLEVKFPAVVCNTEYDKLHPNRDSLANPSRAPPENLS